MRRHFLYTPLDHFGQTKQIFRSSDRAPLRLLDEWILRTGIRPGSGKIGQLPILRQIEDPPLSPAPLAIDQLKLPAAPRMKRVDDRELLFRMGITRRSPRPTPKAKSNAASAPSQSESSASCPLKQLPTTKTPTPGSQPQSPGTTNISPAAPPLSPPNAAGNRALQEKHHHHRPAPALPLLDLHLALSPQRRLHADFTLDFLGQNWPVTPVGRKTVALVHHPEQCFWVIPEPPDPGKPVWPDV